MWPLNIKFNTYGFLKGLIDGYGYKKGMLLIEKQVLRSPLDL